MKNFLLIVIISFLSINTFAQCDCVKIFDEIYAKVEQNYAGWNDKVTPKTKPKLKLLTDNLRNKAKLSKSDAECNSVIKTWLAFFKDGHLHSKFLESNAVSQSKKAVPEPLIIEMNEAAALDYFKQTKPLDEIEGIWKSENYRFAIMRDVKNPNNFNAVILSTKSDIWKPDEVKITFTKSANSYSADFYEWDKAAITKTETIINQNVLDLGFTFFEKEFPSAAKPINFADYVYDHDPTNPKLKFPKPGLAVFTLKSMQSENLELVEGLLKKYEPELTKTEYLIIDLRGNEGGNINVGKPLLPYLYTNPIKNWGAKYMVTEENIKTWFSEYVQESYEKFDAPQKKEYDDYMADLLKHKNSLYTPDEEPKPIVFDETKLFPKKVAVLIDHKCFSSGELFVMFAKQSKKVKIYGENSGGMMDYGDILPYKTSCPAIRLILPWTRFNWLDNGISVDKNGIAPDVKIPKSEKDWIEFVYQNLKKAK